MTPEGLARLKLDEGLRLTAYPDPLSPLAKVNALPPSKRPLSFVAFSGAPWTIGYGHTGPDVSPGMTIDKAEAVRILLLDIARHEKELDRFLPWWRSVSSPVRQDVMSNMAFNLGIYRLLGFKDTLQHIHFKRYDHAAEAMLDSLWARQVGDRADRLAAMMKTGERV